MLTALCHVRVLRPEHHGRLVKMKKPMPMQKSYVVSPIDSASQSPRVSS